MEMSGKPLRAVNVGIFGITGYYDRMSRETLNGLPQAIQLLGVWLWVFTLPAHLEIFRIPPGVTVALLLKLMLLALTLRVYWQLVVAIWFCVKWLKLEISGVQWVRRNGHNFRVLFYREGDESLIYDTQTRELRLNQELHTAHNRRGAFAVNVLALAISVGAYVGLPFGFDYARQFMNAAFIDYVDYWRVLHYAQLIWLYWKIVPTAVSFCACIFHWLTYLCGAQYVPGAKLRDPVIPEVTLETLRAENALGEAAIVSPEMASSLLGSTA